MTGPFEKARVFSLGRKKKACRTTTKLLIRGVQESEEPLCTEYFILTLGKCSILWFSGFLNIFCCDCVSEMEKEQAAICWFISPSTHTAQAEPAPKLDTSYSVPAHVSGRTTSGALMAASWRLPDGQATSQTHSQDLNPGTLWLQPSTA